MSSSALPPVPGTSFVGRGGALELVIDLLAAPGLVSLVGGPGVGKTRLALEAIRRVAAGAASEAGAVAWVELAPVITGGSVDEAVAAALVAHDQPGRSTIEAVSARLRHGHQLLVLDNCEHLAAACAETVAALLRELPGLTVLATSRQALGLDDERVYEVPPMSTLESAELFYERAGRHQVGFAVGDESAEAVTEICRRLDGVPLAVELAAGRVGLLPPVEIAARLADDPLSVLGHGVRPGDDRHQSVRAALDWSYSLLDPAEAALLSRLSVFTGGFTSTAAGAVCSGGPISAPDVAGLLVALAAKSLLVIRRSDLEDRFDLLDTVRCFAAERLVDTEEADVVAARHRGWCVAFAEDMETALTGPDQLDALVRVDADIDNLRAAFFAGLDLRSLEALRIASALTVWWRVRGRFAEGQQLLEAALDRAPGAPDVLRARAHWGAGFLAHMLGDDGTASVDLQQALVLSRNGGDRSGEARALLLLGNLAMERGGDAQSLLHESASLAARAGDGWCEAHALALECTVLQARGLLEDARRTGERGVTVARRGSDLQGLRVSLHCLAELALGRGDDVNAEAFAAEAIVIMRALGDSYALAGALRVLGEAAVSQGQFDRARAILVEGLSIARSTGNPDLVCLLLSALGSLALEEGELATARTRFEEAVALAGGADRALCQTLTGLARVCIAEGEQCGARVLLDRSFTVAMETGNRHHAASVTAEMASLAGREGHYERAVALWRRTLSLSGDLDNPRRQADLLEAFAVAATDAGGTTHAARLLGASQMIEDAVGDRACVERRRRFEGCVQRLRDRMGSEQFEQARAEGASMSPAAAITSAIKGQGRRKRPSRGWASLTGTEQEVAALIAEGYSNREISARLFVSEATVPVHIRRLFAKLGISSRHRLAVEAAHHASEDGDP